MVLECGLGNRLLEVLEKQQGVEKAFAVVLIANGLELFQMAQGEIKRRHMQRVAEFAGDDTMVHFG